MESMRKTVVLVDSDQTSQLKVKNRLEQHEYFVEIFESSHDVIDRITKQNHVFAVIVNVSMNNGSMTGLSLARKMSDIVAVVVTSSDNDALYRAKQEGFITYCDKTDDGMLPLLLRRSHNECSLRTTVFSLSEVVHNTSRKIDEISHTLNEAVHSFNSRAGSHEERISSLIEFKNKLEADGVVDSLQDIVKPIAKMNSLKDTWIIKNVLKPSFKVAAKIWFIPITLALTWYYVNYFPQPGMKSHAGGTHNEKVS